MGWTVYILRCGDGTLYTGCTNDLPRRLAAHRSGRGAKYTRSRLPVEPVYREEAADKSAALRREAAGKADAPRLSVSAQVKGGFLLAEVTNAVSGDSRFEDGLPVTAKPAGGQGLRSARRTLDRHGGALRCSRQGDVFHTQVMLPL